LRAVRSGRTCQRTLAEQEILRDVVRRRRGSQVLLSHQREAHQQSSASSEDEVEADEDHHEHGRHVGGVAATFSGGYLVFTEDQRPLAERGLAWKRGEVECTEPSGVLSRNDDYKEILDSEG
jgi:hypothetical protein